MPPPATTRSNTMAAKKTSSAKAKKVEQHDEQSGTAYWARMSALPAHLRVTSKIRRAVERLGTYAKALERFDATAVELFTKSGGIDPVNPSELVTRADGLLRRAAEMGDRGPQDPERPPQGGGAARPGTLTPGKAGPNP